LRIEKNGLLSQLTRRRLGVVSRKQTEEKGKRREFI